MAARCADPNCSCRSPDLERFTNQVLRRDAARTDYIVIPVIAGVLANCTLTQARIADGDDDGEGDQEFLDSVRAVRALATASANGSSWDDDTHAYGIIANPVFCTWPGIIFWGSISWFRVKLDIDWAPRPSRDMAAAVRALNPTHHSRGRKASSRHLRRQLGGPSRWPQFRPARQGRPATARCARRSIAPRQSHHLAPILSAAVDDWTLPSRRTSTIPS
jgi:hypothetical protein